MLIDANEVASGSVIQTQICIVGGGIAGIAMGLEFEKAGIEYGRGSKVAVPTATRPHPIFTAAPASVSRTISPTVPAAVSWAAAATAGAASAVRGTRSPSTTVRG